VTGFGEPLLWGLTGVDLVLVLAGVSFAVAGFRRGLVVGVLSFVGLVGGGGVGMLAAPPLVGQVQAGLRQSVAAVVIVLVAAVVGQTIAGMVGYRVRSVLTWRPARLVDATLGAVVSVTAMLLVVWFLAGALRQSPVSSFSTMVRESSVITAVDEVVPDPARSWFGSFRGLLNEGEFPRVFSGLSPERILPVDPPDLSQAETPEIAAAAQSVLKVTGNAQACGRQVVGTGFVYSPERVMTNAHVVAGVEAPAVQILGEGRTYDARVVAFDPRRDLAVLAVPGLEAAPLDFTTGGERGDDAVAAGFPRSGPFDLAPARIRERIDARGPDIYNSSQVTREVFSLFAEIEPGNSGGPLLAADGSVYGVIFAKSLDDAQTGYAITAEEASAVAQAGIEAASPVGTGACAA
jgi:S1-C subfamily serine protease